jgi:hypothetical protein
MFRMKKDFMVLKVPEGDDKEREYDVVSMLPVQANDAAASSRAALPAPAPAKPEPATPDQQIICTPPRQKKGRMQTPFPYQRASYWNKAGPESGNHHPPRMDSTMPCSHDARGRCSP